MAYEEYTVKVYQNGTKFWYQNEKLHRTDGPAIEWANGDKEWFQNGERHRTDGPAVEYANGAKFWYQNGKLHRTDGPAIEYANGTKLWFLKGIQCFEEEFKKFLLMSTSEIQKNSFDEHAWNCWIHHGGEM